MHDRRPARLRARARHGLLKGVGALLLASWVTFGVLHAIAGSNLDRLWAAGTTPRACGRSSRSSSAALLLGFFATLSGACPLRQHVLAGQGRLGAWSFLAGFYLAGIVYTSWLQPHIGSWPI